MSTKRRKSIEKEKKVEHKENVQTLHFLHTTLNKHRGFIPNMGCRKKERKMREQKLMINSEFV